MGRGREGGKAVTIACEQRWTDDDEAQYGSHPHAKKLMCDLIFR